MAEISIQELLDITLTHPYTHQLLAKHSYKLDEYRAILLQHDIGSDIMISTYEDYVHEIPNLFPKLKRYLSTFEYNTLTIFKPQIDTLVLKIFEELTS
nr:TPA: hypothetical protein [Oryctes rhinoceros nudivirus]